MIKNYIHCFKVGSNKIPLILTQVINIKTKHIQMS